MSYVLRRPLQSVCRIWCVTRLSFLWLTVPASVFASRSRQLSFSSSSVSFSAQQTNYWALSNLFGVAFSMQGLKLISLGSTINGLIMLVRVLFDGRI
jgi:hypothetical protein